MKYHLPADNGGMDTRKNSDKRLKSEDIRYAVFMTCSCLVGSLSAFFGGLTLALCVTALVGAGTLAYFFRKLLKKTALTGSPSAPAVDTIPSDRIDSLTKLANENGLMAWLSEKSARLIADSKGIIVLSADLADFDQVERSYAKPIVEAVLIEVARRVATCTGVDGIAARTSGDEFAAIATVVPANYAEVAEEEAGKLAELIQRPVELPTGVIWIGGSVGASYGAVTDGALILAQSREALKQAKRLGRGHYVVSKLVKPS